MRAMRQVLTILLSFAGIVSPASSGPAEGTLQRLKEMHRTVMDPNQVFSISAVLAELDQLEKTVSSGDSAAQG
jgi:hypothetical protein